ncbi:MAG: adenosine kinase, partial [Lentimicrobium sp.]|nr:adenosine kinase [Lentimicrobium sp.]
MAKILGLGNALVDIMIMLPNDELLIEAGLPKGSMQHVQRNVIDDLLVKTNTLHQETSSGGSAANAIHGLA